jgi:hypothetical protein
MLTNRGKGLQCLAGMCAVFLLGLLNAAGAKAQVNTATILGTVTDSSGAVVAGAKISAKNTGTGVARTGVGLLEFMRSGRMEIDG